MVQKETVAAAFLSHVHWDSPVKGVNFECQRRRLWKISEIIICDGVLKSQTEMIFREAFCRI